MTAQIGDTFKYESYEYRIVAISEPLQFRPQDYGIQPKGVCSACWKGYWCEYNISEKGIILENFYVNSYNDYYPEVNGVQPLRGQENQYFHYMGHHCYKGINIKINYTGKIVVGKDFLSDYYIHMGYQRAWAYETLKELVFEEGALVEVIDHSAMADMLRAKIQEDPEFGFKLHSNIPQFVEDSFDLSLKTKVWWIK